MYYYLQQKNIKSIRNKLSHETHYLKLFQKETCYILYTGYLI